jgi:hypothetical protein
MPSAADIGIEQFCYLRTPSCWSIFRAEPGCATTTTYKSEVHLPKHSMKAHNKTMPLLRGLKRGPQAITVAQTLQLASSLGSTAAVDQVPDNATLSFMSNPDGKVYCSVTGCTHNHGYISPTDIILRHFYQAQKVADNLSTWQ